MLTAAALAAEFAAAAANAPRKAAQAVAKTAYDVQADAQAMAPVDTGFLRSSITTSLADGGLSAEVGPEAHYGVFLELGTYKMAPQPYLIPALERRTDPFLAALARVADL